ncbi:hypothetical protein LJC32_03645 [Oscillospiraceae bacterium OttesenSCG-928-F05]|nr:hypothetical protein [Oscillospiraceae bacterium OttesenSCG-928-F05]
MNQSIQKFASKLGSYYTRVMVAVILVLALSGSALATDTMWTVGARLITDVYAQIAGISTLLAGLMSAVAVVGAKLSNNQHKTDQAWDWLKRIWIAWAVINGIGAFIAYVVPFFQGLATLNPGIAAPSATP